MHVVIWKRELVKILNVGEIICVSVQGVVTTVAESQLGTLKLAPVVCLAVFL